jgi:NADH:ubiquinone oxidoreductase subunit E
VATFYHFFSMKPRGEHTCVVCTGTACYIKDSPALLRASETELAAAQRARLDRFSHQINVCMATACHSSGSEEIKDRLAAEVKARGIEQRCLIRGVGCRGLCTAGPMVGVEPDGLLYHHVTPDDAVDLLASVDGMPVERIRAHTGDPFYARQHRIVLEHAGEIDPERIEEYIGETVEPWSYLKSAYYAPRGYPDGLYRVGPLARLNVATSVDTPKAGGEWAEFRQLESGAVLSSFHYHYARLIEMLYALERIGQLLDDPDILNTRVRAHAEPNNLEGIGVAEAPRGTLLHHYKIDEHGLIVWANLIIATGHNNLAMNRGVFQVARHFVDGERLQEGMLNRVEAVIRAYDQCLSCSTHALGKMPLWIQLLAPDGAVLDEMARGADRA